MDVAMTGEGFKGYVMGGVILAAIAAVAYVAWKGAAVAKQVVTKDLNPASTDNLAYRGVNGLGAAISGDRSFSLGSAIYDATHRAYDPNAPAVASTSGSWAAVRHLFTSGSGNG